MSASSAPPPATAGAPRIVGLDAARALAVVAMVYGHTMDAVLSPEARGVPWVVSYWHVRNFTAPLFLFVSGWVLFLVLEKRRLTGWPALKSYLPRVGLLFALGYLIRFPFWDLPGFFRFDPELWRYATTFDALQCIAASMLLTLGLAALVSRRWQRLALLGLLAGLLVVLAEGVWARLAQPGVLPVWPQTFGGGDTRFSVFPWSAYFLLGACLGSLFGAVRHPKLRVLALVGLGLGLYALTQDATVSQLPNTSPQKVLWRLGPVLCALGLMLSLPERVAHRLAPIGRASLWAYVLHLPVAYGWAFWPGLSTRVGPTLSDTAACLLAVGVVVTSVTTAVLAKRFLALSKWRPLWLRARPWLLAAPRALRVRVSTALERDGAVPSPD